MPLQPRGWSSRESCNNVLSLMEMIKVTEKAFYIRVGMHFRKNMQASNVFTRDTDYLYTHRSAKHATNYSAVDTILIITNCCPIISFGLVLPSHSVFYLSIWHADETRLQMTSPTPHVISSRRY